MACGSSWLRWWTFGGVLIARHDEVVEKGSEGVVESGEERYVGRKV